MNGTSFEDYRLECCNPDCQWSGLASECVTPKHEPDHLLCPICHEVTEPLDDHPS